MVWRGEHGPPLELLINEIEVQLGRFDERWVLDTFSQLVAAQLFQLELHGIGVRQVLAGLGWLQGLHFFDEQAQFLNDGAFGTLFDRAQGFGYRGHEACLSIAVLAHLMADGHKG